ncbi:BrnT family toxin [Nitrosomonas ureae]|uniref:BrnT family toxin n=1 Tax=Nitrosomonas ureae TaxID=44577 RepID=UPI0021596B66|nr:BrnT family toxin [Nitrosomonas ureae]
MWDAALIWQDTRHDYGENRMVALAPIDERLFCVVYVDREDERRIISLRKANRREFDYYEQEIN